MVHKFFHQFALTLAAVALIAGCKSKTTAPEAPTDGGGGMSTETPSVDSTPLDFEGGSDSGKIAGLNTVNFDYDKSSLSGEAKRKLQGNAEWMKANTATRVQIEGHTDARGSIEYNIALGERRANAVKAYMISLGIPANRLSTVSYGKERPLDPADNDGAWAKNRRANFLPAK